MKKIFIYLLAMGLVLFAASCGEESADPSIEEEQATAETDGAAETANQRVDDGTSLAVSLWNLAGLRDKPGRGKEAEYITSINFGELVTYLGESEEIEKEKRTYAKVELVDGKVGWVNEYLLAVDAMRAVAIEDIEVYTRPDLTTYKGKKFKKGDIFAVLNGDRDDWVEVLGKEKDITGWVMNDEAKFKTGEIDVTVAILMDRAMDLDDPKAKEEALKNIAENSTFSSSALMPLVEEALSSVPTIPDLPANQLYVTATDLNVRSEPDNEADNVAFQLNQGDICNILTRGELVKIREMEDYWYEIEKDGQTGWIYGFFTSKRLEE
ncbi:MAG: SH3 domain-containing protein [Bacteroidota bacterium]